MTLAIEQPDPEVSACHSEGHRVTGVLNRVFRGPEPPIGKPYNPRAKWRCVVGLHRWSEVWDMTRTDVQQDGSTYRASFSVNLGRSPDYEHCCWCGLMRNIQGGEPWR